MLPLLHSTKRSTIPLLYKSYHHVASRQFGSRFALSDIKIKIFKSSAQKKHSDVDCPTSVSRKKNPNPRFTPQQPPCPPQNKLLYKMRVALPPDYDRVLCFMNEAYYRHEPTMINLGLRGTEPSGALREIMHENVSEGMTIIAEDPQDRILGAAVNTGSCPWDPQRSVEFGRRCEEGPARDAIEFLAYVSSKPNVWERFCVLKVFECNNLAVAEEFRGRGIARRLLEESWCMARDCGYRLFRIDCTSRYTARIAEGFGWEKICTVPYCRYVRNGELVFKHIKEPHTEVNTYVDRLTYCKDYYPPYKKNTKASTWRSGEKKK
ncbi:hypothetical protein KM043_005136 [Ampulex compressa]|nr:hypothetical protein KM043_005136 [Ampulex compressa]